ncbi:MAG: hypothetical protein AAF747_05420, partial [Planctomycetota bacterium]
VVLWAWFGDQSRGRRRCRKCWYDMSAFPATDEGRRCPECGHRHKHEGLLYQTRRRKWLAAIGVCIALCAQIAWRMPHYNERGPSAFVPTIALVLLFEQLDNLGGPPGPAAGQISRPVLELDRRIGRESTPDLYRRWLVRSAIDIAGDADADVADRLRAIRVMQLSEDPNGSYLYQARGEVNHAPPYDRRVSSFNVDAEGAISALAMASIETNNNLRSNALNALAAYYSSFGAPKPGGFSPARHAYAALLASTASDDVRVREAAARAIHGLGGNAPAPVWRIAYRTIEDTALPSDVERYAEAVNDSAATQRLLLEDVESDDERTAVLAAWGLGLVGEGDDVRTALRQADATGTADLQLVAFAALRVFADRHGEELDAAWLTELLQDDDPERWHHAFATLAEQGGSELVLAERLLKAARAAEDTADLAFARSWSRHLRNQLDALDSGTRGEIEAVLDAVDAAVAPGQ